MVFSICVVFQKIYVASLVVACDFLYGIMIGLAVVASFKIEIINQQHRPIDNSVFIRPGPEESLCYLMFNCSPFPEESNLFT